MTPEPEEAPRPVWQVVVISLIGFALAGGFMWLCVWQVERAAWKHDLIARVEARVHALPIGWPQAAALPPDQAEYRQVILSGTFDHSRETLVQAVTEHGGGFWVMTPLTTPDGQTVLINRGFVPSDRRDPTTRPEGQVEGLITLQGLLRLTEPGGGFLRSNDPDANRWYSRDTAAIAAARGLGPVAGYFIDAEASAQPDSLSIGGLTVIKFRDTHMVYALTWFALAAMVATGLAILLKHDRRVRRRWAIAEAARRREG